MRLLEFLELVCKKPLQHAVSAAVGFAIQQFPELDSILCSFTVGSHLFLRYF